MCVQCPKRYESNARTTPTLSARELPRGACRRVIIAWTPWNGRIDPVAHATSLSSALQAFSTVVCGQTYPRRGALLQGRTGAADCDCVPAPRPRNASVVLGTACPFPLINLDFFFVNKNSCIRIANIKFTRRVQLLPLLLFHCAGWTNNRCVAFRVGQ